MIEHILLGGPMIVDILVGIGLGFGLVAALRASFWLLDTIEPLLFRLFGSRSHPVESDENGANR